MLTGASNILTAGSNAGIIRRRRCRAKTEDLMNRLTIPFDTFTLSAVVAELKAALAGARVQKIQQPLPHELTLALYGRAGAHRLLISTDAQNPRVHLTRQKRDNPLNAPGFCQVCRKYLDGAILAEITLPQWDRIVHLAFRAADGETVTLIVELTGRNSNAILVSGTGVVRGAMRAAPPDSDRPLRPGVAYAPPPGGTRDALDPRTILSPRDAAFATLSNDADDAAQRTWLAETFGLGKWAAGEIVQRGRETGDLPAALCDLMAQVRAETFAPHEITDAAGDPAGVWAFAPVTVASDHRFAVTDLSAALDALYQARDEAAGADGVQAQLLRAVAREIVYRTKELQSADATLAEAHRADDYERQGNVLLSFLDRVERGAASVALPDLYGDDPDATVTITLDGKKSPRENAEGFFTRARKARDAAEYTESRKADLTRDLARLRALEAVARDAGSDDTENLQAQLAAIVGAARAGADKPEKAARAQPKPGGGHRIRTFTVDGYELLVGETAEANDYLTTRMAAPNDLWMHVRAAPGAHGVLKTAGTPPARMPETVIRRAAEIVAARSGTSIKHAGLVAVDILEKRFVRKPRGAKPGLVIYEPGRERVLDIEPRL